MIISLNKLKYQWLFILCQLSLIFSLYGFKLDPESAGRERYCSQN